MKIALITGIMGQDGYFLTDFLLKKNYRVFGLVGEVNSLRFLEFSSEFPDVKLIKGDLKDFSSLIQAIEMSNPDEIYNLGGISLVSLSFKQPELITNVNALGPIRIIEALVKLGAKNKIKLYQSSSSEMFGRVNDSPQNESTRFNPVSPYGIAKVYAHQICNNYREIHNMHISCGILYNHESERRSEQFVTRKITKGISQIKKGELSRIKLGTLESKRDWGYAADYIEAMWLMLQQEKAGDFVIATGKLHSVRDFLETAIQAADLDGEPEDYVQIDEKLKRPKEVELLVGDISKAKMILNWEPKVNFNDLVHLMVKHDLEQI
jgi:GDPmannose 4,6-dehydratase